MISLLNSTRYLRTCLDILIGTKIAFDQIPGLFMILKILNKTGICQKFFNLIKVDSEKESTVSIILND